MVAFAKRKRLEKALGDQSLHPFGISPPPPLHHQSAGVDRQGSEEADKSRGGVLQRRRRGKASLPDFESAG